MPEKLLKKISIKVDEIYQALISLPSTNNISILGGDLGKALFYIYYSKNTGNEEAMEAALEIIGSAVMTINKISKNSSLSMGLTGLAWLISHIEKEKLVDTGSKKLLAEYDSILFPHLLSQLESGNFDYLHGALGAGSYFLNRKRTKKNVMMIEQTILGLIKISKTVDNHVKWNRYDINNSKVIIGEYNWGLSHGTPSILMFLISCYEEGLFKDEIKPLVKGTVEFMLTVKQDPMVNGSFFPYGSNDISPNPEKTRLAWCYGDLGIIFTLWKANDIFKLNLDKLLSEMVDFEVGRKEPSLNQIYDAGFCHGSSGAAHIFHKMYCCTGDTKYKDAARYWYSITVNMAKFKDGLAGYMTYRSNTKPNYIPDTSLIEGISGIGLVLLSAKNPQRYNWDSIFLLR